MKKFFSAAAILIPVLLTSCINMGKRVDGNGNISTEVRTVAKAEKIRLLGDMNVYLSQGPTSVKVETDENIIPYVVTEVDGGWLTIKNKEGFNIHTDKAVKVYVTTPNISDIDLAGSGNVDFSQKFSGNDDMTFKIAGSGDIKAEINAPKVDAEISGSGNLQITGETKNVEIHIAGSGNFQGPSFKTEKAEVNIAGSGDAELYAEDKLKTSIAGSGNVKYRGNAVVDSHVAGSGAVIKVQ